MIIFLQCIVECRHVSCKMWTSLNQPVHKEFSLTAITSFNQENAIMQSRPSAIRLFSLMDNHLIVTHFHWKKHIPGMRLNSRHSKGKRKTLAARTLKLGTWGWYIESRICNLLVLWCSTFLVRKPCGWVFFSRKGWTGLKGILIDKQSKKHI